MRKAHKIKFLANEGFSYLIYSTLKERGFDVVWIGDIASGVDDNSIFDISQKDGRVILTEDKDFGELAIRFNRKTNGIILLRIEPDRKDLRKKKFLQLIENYPDKLKGHLTVIDEQKFRFREI